MFSKLRKYKSEKPAQPPKLRGMPALKQMRSSRREETLKNGSVLATLSEIEGKAIVTGKEAIHPTIEEVERPQHIPITPNYKRSTSPDSGHHSSESRQANHVDRIACANGSTFLFFGDTSKGITEDIPETNEDGDDVTVSVNSPWRISKGDSGYKSKDDEKAESKNKKQKKSRRKSNGRPSNCGLHQVKQQRKANREGVSMSMRALTPKERESIQCLEDVLKGHLPIGAIVPLEPQATSPPGDDDSSDEVFHSESDIENEAEVIFMEDKERVEAIDHGYASVNDVSRKYSIESVESVGSIIDLVGNLSKSPSSQTSRAYSAVESPKNSDDVMKQPADDARLDKFSNGTSQDEGIQQDPRPLSEDVIVHPDEAISQLDDVINSFNFESDQEGNDDKEREGTFKVSHMQSVDFVNNQEMEMNKREKQESVDAALEHNKEKGDSRSERKKKKKTKRHKSRDSASDDEKEKKRRERRKERDSETEKERRERKRLQKEEKRKKRREISESEDEVRRREEHIARHVAEISTLTQNMIITAQKNNEPEPIYAQVKKPKNKKDINGNLKFDDISPLEEVVPDPPSAFANPTAEEIELERRIIFEETPEKREDEFSKFRLTSTPVSSKLKHERAYTSMHDGVVKESHILPEPKRPISDSSQYSAIIQPYLSGSNPQLPGRLFVSASMLHDSSQNLKQVRSPGPKVLQIDPSRNSVKETIFETTAPPSAFRDQVISRMDPKRSSDPSKNEKVQRRPPRVRHNLHPGRPVSLNLEENPKTDFFGEALRGASTKHSSFREEKSGGDQGQKTRPFVIRTTKKTLQLC